MKEPYHGRDASCGAALTLFLIFIAAPVAYGQPEASRPEKVSSGASGADSGSDRECPARPAEESEARKLAGEWFEKAEKLFNEDQSQEALDAFLCSLELVEHPATLFNAAQAARSAGEYETAYRLLRRYREMVPSGEMTDEAAKQLEDLKQRLDHLEKSVAAVGALGEPKQAEKKPAVEKPTEPSPAKGPANKSKPKDRSGSNLVIPGWVAIGVGGALLLTGAVTGSMALSLNSDLAEKCDGGICSSAQRDDLHRRDTLAMATDVLMVVGVASAAAGAVLLTVVNRAEKPAKTEVGLFVGPGLAVAAAAGRF